MKKFKITFNSPVTLYFVLFCLVVLTIGLITDGKSTEYLFMTYHSSLMNPLTYIRFITHVLGHSGISHYVGNATYILLLGPLLEEKYGSVCLLKIIVITALVTGVTNYLLFPQVALCGASGIVFAFIVLSSFTGFKEGEIPLTFLLIVILFGGQQTYEGITINDNISQITHIIGGMVGSIIGYKLNEKY